MQPSAQANGSNLSMANPEFVVESDSRYHSRFGSVLICFLVCIGLLCGGLAQIVEDSDSVVSRTQKLSKWLFLSVAQNIVEENPATDAYAEIVKQVTVNFIAFQGKGHMARVVPFWRYARPVLYQKVVPVESPSYHAHANSRALKSQWPRGCVDNIKEEADSQCLKTMGNLVSANRVSVGPRSFDFAAPICNFYPLGISGCLEGGIPPHLLGGRAISLA